MVLRWTKGRSHGIVALMEKTPKKRDDWITRAQARDKWLPLSMLAVAIGAYVAREGSVLKYSRGTIDSILLVLFLLLMVWLLWPSQRDKADDSDH